MLYLYFTFFQPLIHCRFIFNLVSCLLIPPPPQKRTTPLFRKTCNCCPLRVFALTLWFAGCFACKPTNPSPVSPKGEKPRHPQIKHWLGNSTRHQLRKGFNSMPSPFRRGQTDTPINRLALGEVQQKNTDLPQPSVFSFAYFFRYWPRPKNSITPLSLKTWSCWRIFSLTLWFDGCLSCKCASKA